MWASFVLSVYVCEISKVEGFPKVPKCSTLTLFWVLFESLCLCIYSLCACVCMCMSACVCYPPQPSSLLRLCVFVGLGWYMQHRALGRADVRGCNRGQMLTCCLWFVLMASCNLLPFIPLPFPSLPRFSI